MDSKTKTNQQPNNNKEFAASTSSALNIGEIESDLERKLTVASQSDRKLLLKNKSSKKSKLPNAYLFELQFLPTEIICEIFSFLGANDLKTLSFVCRLWGNLSKLNRLWKPLCRHCFTITSLSKQQSQQLGTVILPTPTTEIEEEGGYRKAFINDLMAEGIYCVQKHDKSTESWRWKIRNFKELKNFVYSDPFSVGGHPWRVLVFPQGNHQPEHFSIYLDVADSEQLKDKNWARSASYCFGVINRRALNHSWIPEKLIKERFWKQERDWGYRQFMSLEHLNADGFIVNNTLIIEVTINVRHSKDCFGNCEAASADEKANSTPNQPIPNVNQNSNVAAAQAVPPPPPTSRATSEP